MADKRKINGRNGKINIIGILYSLDATLGLLFSIVILGVTIGYLERTNYNRHMSTHLIDAGYDTLAFLQEDGALNSYYLDNQWFFNSSISDVRDGAPGVPSVLSGYFGMESARRDYCNNWLSLSQGAANLQSPAAGRDFFGNGQGSSVSAWLLFKNDSKRKCLFDDVFQTGNVKRMRIDIEADGRINVSMQNDPNNGDQSIATTQAVQADTWHHIVVMVNVSGSDLKVYVDNVSRQVSGSPSFVGIVYSSESPIRSTLGSTYDSLDYYNGSVDNFFIYNRSLTAGDVASLYINQSVSEELKAKYTFDSESTGLNESIARVLPSQYLMIVQLIDNQSRHLGSAPEPAPSSINSFIATGDRVVAVTGANRVIDFVIARYYIVVK